MLRDEPTKSVHGDYDRRWITDEYFDLIVWYTREGAVYGFQLCYDKPRWERALTWINNRGFSHTQIDAGEETPMRNRSPVLVPDGSFPADLVTREFVRRSAELPADLRDLVLEKISEFKQRRKV